jgi:6-phosphogluconolactonase (cycloisomerase 2 family)
MAWLLMHLSRPQASRAVSACTPSRAFLWRNNGTQMQDLGDLGYNYLGPSFRARRYRVLRIRLARRLSKHFEGMATMKKTPHETEVRKLIMLGAALTLLIGLPFAFANRAFANPTPKFEYVANGADNTVSAYTINSATGALSPIAGSPFPAGSEPDSVVVDPSGRFAYVANEFANTISAYAINTATGALSAVSSSPFASGRFPTSVTVDPSGQFAYVTNSCVSSRDCSTGTVWAYTINRSTGALRPVSGSPFTTGEFPVSVTVDPTGRFAYVANSNNAVGNGSVSAYTINHSTGALSAVAGSPFAAGNNAYSVAVDPSGKFVYVTNENSGVKGNISAYIINPSTGALSAMAGSPFASGNGPISVTVDPSGHFVYVAAEGVSAYTINRSTGDLRAVPGSPFATGDNAYSVAVDPSGQFAYVANQFSNSVSAFTINSSTGALRPLAGSPFAAGSNPVSIAIAGQAVTTSVLTLSPRSLAFGNLPIHTSSAAQSVTVTNTSGNAVAITGIALRGTASGQFTFTDDCGKSLAAYRTCTLEAIFRPTTEGAKTAFLDVNGGGGGLRSVKLTGTGT